MKNCCDDTNAKELKAADIMTAPLFSLNADLSLKEAARFLLSHGFSGAPVIDDAGRPVGVLTLKDIARYAEWHMEADDSKEEQSEDIRQFRENEEELGKAMNIDHLRNADVRQIMTPGIRKVRKDEPVRAVVDALLSGPYHRVFVADSHGALVGVISTIDILKHLTRAL